MPKTSTRYVTLPIRSGKPWVQPMETVGAILCTTISTFPQLYSRVSSMVINHRLLPSSYTNYTHLFTRDVNKFTSVNSQLSAVYTGPITTTTTYISI